MALVSPIRGIDTIPCDDDCRITNKSVSDLATIEIRRRKVSRSALEICNRF
jgi:hypothetical protein